MSSKSIVRKHLNFIVNSVLETFGRTNVLSIILLGSWARGSGAYRIVNHKPIVESDYDIIVVVNTQGYVKALWITKALERHITSNLQKRGLSSHVSIFSTTFTMLKLSKPSIRFMDLRINGKVLAGEDVISLLPLYSIDEIPYDDIVLLLFNRMTEMLDALSANMLTDDDFLPLFVKDLPKILEKGYFVLLQVLLLCNKKLVYRGISVEEIELLSTQVSFKSALFKQIFWEYKNLFYNKNSAVKQSEVSVENLYSLLNHWKVLLTEILKLALSKRDNFVPDRSSDIIFLIRKYWLGYNSSLFIRIIQFFVLSIQYHSMGPKCFAMLCRNLLNPSAISIYVPLSEKFFSIEKLLKKSINKHFLKFDEEVVSLRSVLKTWETLNGGYLDA